MPRVLLLITLAVAPLAAQYGGEAPTNPVARLNARLERGEIALTHDGGRRGYLMSLLEALAIDPASQMLVFSKTSLQMDRIGPANPRALYFNDEVSVGFVPGGHVLELATFDRDLGVVFYTLGAARRDGTPRLERQDRDCGSCHSTAPWAQMVVQSVYPSATGEPFIALGTIMPLAVDHTTPFEERWGGWYVTGTHGRMKHKGNSLPASPFRPLEIAGPQNATTLNEASRGRFDASVYPGEASDLVALMVFEHQMHVTNLISRVNRIAGGTVRAKERLDDVIEKLVGALFFSGEAKLTDAVRGVAPFGERFAMQGPRDAQGRSLRQLDLETRLFRYPLSYMVYSPVYESMPAAVRRKVAERIAQVLAGEGGAAYSHLAAATRQAIGEVLADTAPRVLNP